MINREVIFDTIESNGKSHISKIYDYTMLVFIIVSIVPLAFRDSNIYFEIIDVICVTIFITDYLLRWITADYKLHTNSKWKAFVCYPFTPFAIIDLLSILPSISFVSQSLKLFRITRLIKIIRVFKFVRYSNNIQILFRVLHKERSILLTVLLIALSYILITALIMFNVEDSEMFKDFFDAVYWATTTLTTVGYGDICPTSDIGRFVSMFSALLGVAVIALPSGVITASYLDELREEKKRKQSSEKQ